ncbi:MAG: DUF4912 domain-containing protein [Verrucomicrobia bacterium]|nr:DUF4912 domain-containing protein [Verrucomicrobiota bacterium]
MKKTAPKTSAKIEPKPKSKPAASAAQPKRSLVSAAMEKVKAAMRPRAAAAKAEASAPPVIQRAAPPSKSKTKKISTAAKPIVTAASKQAAAPKARAAAKEAPVEVPSILLEGDDAPAPKASGPGQRYALGPSAPVEKFADSLGELPTAYGTGRLTLTARDPHWLYAHWDFTDEQLRKHNRASADGHLVVRVQLEGSSVQPFSEVHVHPESRNWFIHVGRGGAKFSAELGYHDKNKKGAWKSLAKSRPTLTPPDSLSDDLSVRFATIPVELSFAQLLALLKQVVRENVPLIEAIQQLRALGYKGLPDVAALSSSKWTPEQERAMAEVLSMDSVRRVWMGSLEITELLRRQLLKDMSSLTASQFGLPSSLNVSSLGASSLSSPFGGVPGKKGFWFMVNAELIIYGATEPDAAVTIGGRKIKLRPDGTFSYRFILPDGSYNLPAVATSADGDDSRVADLAFSRSTNYAGEVGKHPQDPALKTPRAENVA